MFCTECGKEIEAGTIFCPNCGTKVEGSVTISSHIGGGVNKLISPMKVLITAIVIIIVGILGLLTVKYRVFKEAPGLPIAQPVGPAVPEKVPRSGITGTYVNQKDPSAHFELKSDGTFHFRHEEKGWDLIGQWQVKGDKLLISYPSGPTPPRKIKDNKIIDDDGTVWVKLELRKEKAISQTSIVGKYREKYKGYMLVIDNSGTFKYQGESSFQGHWKIDGNKIEFFTYVGPQRIPAPFLGGEIKGRILHSTGGTTWVKQD
jgi:hypothetical protein